MASKELDLECVHHQERRHCETVLVPTTRLIDRTVFCITMVWAWAWLAVVKSLGCTSILPRFVPSKVVKCSALEVHASCFCRLGHPD